MPGNQTAQAIEEAIEAEIPLVVAVAEHVPIHDMLRVCGLSFIIIESVVKSFLDPFHTSNAVQDEISRS